MSTGPFVMGVAAALVVGASVVSASGDKPKSSKHGSHEVAASTYSSSFPTVGAMCASGSTGASRQTLSSPFAAHGGSSAYADFFFRAGFNAGFRSASVTGASGRNAIVSMPSSGRPGNHGANVVMLPSKAGHGGAVASALANGTPAVGASAQSLQGLDVGSASATPEPATLLLLVTGIGGVFLARRRSRTSN